MGLLGKIKQSAEMVKAAADGLNGDSYFEARAERELALDRRTAFEIGTRHETLPRTVGMLALDLSTLTSPQLTKTDVIPVRVGLDELDETLVAMLKMRAGLSAPELATHMRFCELSHERIGLQGELRPLGQAALSITLGEVAAARTQAAVSLGVTIMPLDIRMAAETQRDMIEDRLQTTMDQFIDEYVPNITEAALRESA